MAVEYLGTSDFKSNGNTFTPHASTDFFLIGMIGEASGSAGSQWATVTWDGLTDAADNATAINFIKRTTTNSVSAALWYLEAPDVSGIGTIAYTGGAQNSSRVCVMYFRHVDLVGTSIYAEATGDGTPDNQAVDPGWVLHAIKGCIVSHDGTAEVPASGFTEVANYAGAPRHGAMGYRADDGNTGWNITGGTRGAYAAACINYMQGGGPVWFF